MLNLQAVSASGTGPLASVAPVSPLDFADVDYHPGLLLPVSFDRSITTDPEYIAACQHGFGSYFEEMVNRSEESDDPFPLVARYYTRRDVAAYIVDTLTRHDERWLVVCSPAPLCWHVGFLVGWLSALALTNDALAWFGVDVLAGCMRRKLRERGHGSAAGRVCGGDGFPLDL
jgi:hypothetical protein